MLGSAYTTTLTLAVISSAIAVGLQRRWPDKLLATRWITLAWGILCLVAFHLTMRHAPPRPWTVEALDAEPWEAVVFPLIGTCLVWPLMRALVSRWPALRLWLAMVLASLPMMAAVTITERYAPLHAGNAVWALSALLAIGANLLASEQLEKSGASLWSLWIYVAQILTLAAIMLTCYGSLGLWCLLAGLALAVIAAARLLAHSGSWSSALALPATTLSCVMLTHVRDYSSLALPAWLAPWPLLLPAIVGVIDQQWGAKRSTIWRVVLAALSAAAIAACIVMTVLSLNGPSEDW